MPVGASVFPRVTWAMHLTSPVEHQRGHSVWHWQLSCDTWQCFVQPSPSPFTYLLTVGVSGAPQMTSQPNLKSSKTAKTLTTIIKEWRQDSKSGAYSGQPCAQPCFVRIIWTITLSLFPSFYSYSVCVFTADLSCCNWPLCWQSRWEVDWQRWQNLVAEVGLMLKQHARFLFQFVSMFRKCLHAWASRWSV